MTLPSWQLARALGAPGVLARVIDIFRAWDEDGSGTVEKREFSKALPMLGLKVSRAQSDELFDTFDEDRSGAIDYSEIHHKVSYAPNATHPSHLTHHLSPLTHRPRLPHS